MGTNWMGSLQMLKIDEFFKKRNEFYFSSSFSFNLNGLNTNLI